MWRPSRSSPRAPDVRPRQEADLELRNHLEERVDRLIGEGWEPEAARAEAHRRFGDLPAYRARLERGYRAEKARQRARGALRDTIADVRFGLRGLLRNPGFTAVVVITLALGIGTNAAVFAVVDRVLLQPLPYPEADRLMLLWNRIGEGPGNRAPVVAPDVAVMQERSREFEAFAFITRVVDASLGAEAGAEHVRVATVTANFFDVLGVTPGLGRPPSATSQGLDPNEPIPPEIVLSDGAWQRVFGGDPGVVGRSVQLNGGAALVVGVTRPGFRLDLPAEAGMPDAVDVWAGLQVPLSAFQRADGRFVDQDSDNSGAVIGRLVGRASAKGAQAEMSEIARQMREDVPGYAAAGVEIEVRPLQEDATSHARALLLALWGGVVAVVLIAWMNVATLLLARGRTREPEVAIRLALGAGRARIARQFMVETGLLVVLGSAAALGLAVVITPALMNRLPVDLGQLSDWAPGGRAALFFVGLTAVTGVFLAGVAVLQIGTVSTRRVREVMGRHRGRGRVRGVLVVTEVALAVVLVVSTGLLIRSVERLERVDPGFESSQALAFSLSVRVEGKYDGPADRAVLMRDIESTIGNLGGVEAVGLVGRLPLAGRMWTQPYGLPGQSEAQWPNQRADFRMITSGFFEAMGTSLLAGRRFTPAEDLSEEHRVVIVDERMAARIAPGGSAIGAVIGFPLDGASVEARVVGVVEHVRNESLRSDGRETLYVPYRQEASRDVSFVVRTGDPAALAPQVRAALRAIDPLLPVHDLRPVQAYVDEAMAPTRFLLTLLGGFGLLALLSASVGVYGLISYEVSRRTHDIGVRMALGAGAGDVVSAVLGDGLRLAALGVAVGCALSALSGRVLAGLVFGVGLADPTTWLVVVGGVFAITALASWIPARRAGRLDPMVALRSE